MPAFLSLIRATGSKFPVTRDNLKVGWLASQSSNPATAGHQLVRQVRRAQPRRRPDSRRRARRRCARRCASPRRHRRAAAPARSPRRSARRRELGPRRCRVDAVHRVQAARKAWHGHGPRPAAACRRCRTGAGAPRPGRGLTAHISVERHARSRPPGEGCRSVRARPGCRRATRAPPASACSAGEPKPLRWVSRSGWRCTASASVPVWRPTDSTVNGSSVLLGGLVEELGHQRVKRGPARDHRTRAQRRLGHGPQLDPGLVGGEGDIGRRSPGRGPDRRSWCASRRMSLLLDDGERHHVPRGAPSAATRRAASAAT